MQIESGLNGYGYAPRTYNIDRKTEEPTQREAETRKRLASALTGSSTLLSSSLANALWAVEGGRDAETGAAVTNDGSTILQTPASTVEQVETVYAEF